MKVGDSFLVSERRIDRIVKIIEGSDLLIIDVYTKFKEFPFTYENREQGADSRCHGICSISLLIFGI